MIDWVNVFIGLKFVIVPGNGKKVACLTLNLFSHRKNCYSLLNVSTGLALAALRIVTLVVKMPMANIPAAQITTDAICIEM